MEKPYEGKAKINITTGYCEITLPAKRPMGTILFLSVFLFLWPVGILSTFIGMATKNVEVDAQPFMFIWCAFAIGITTMVVRKMIWMVFGKEIITFERGELKIQRKNLIGYRTKTYDLNQVTNFNTQVYQDGLFDANSKRNFWKGFTQGTILFDYGMKTIQMGESIHEGEARQIISMLVQKGIIKQEQIFSHINQNLNKHWGN